MDRRRPPKRRPILGGSPARDRAGTDGPPSDRSLLRRPRPRASPPEAPDTRGRIRAGAGGAGRRAGVPWLRRQPLGRPPGLALALVEPSVRRLLPRTSGGIAGRFCASTSAPVDVARALARPQGHRLG